MAKAEHLDADQWRRVDALLADALNLPDDERDGWLRRLPPEDADLEPLLRSLLIRERTGSDEFLARPVTASTLAAVEQELESEQAGRTVGPYTLIRELGAGGMGTVWLAQRTDGTIRRPVALKLPRYGWARGVGARLQAERDSLASLEHPNIARLYDAGTTAGGRPYFAMEYVDGVPIDEYVTKHGLDVDARLGLFLQIARAVSHAHARLIVHRDLKPSNVLVTPAGEVRLLDFGAAKLLAPGETGPSDLTREAGRALSPEYAAPEYLRGQQITVAADVYSLGVVLFELLTGERPHASGSRALVAAHVAGAEPARLASSVVAHDRTLARAFRGDIDAILSRALADDPADRYASVDAMAEDVRRHLAGEPVQARRITGWYRGWRFVARHRVGVGLGALAICSLVAGLGVALWQARVARDNAARAERVTQFVTSIFSHATPKDGVGGGLTAADVLRDAGRRIEVELAGEHAVAAEIGLIVGQSLDDLGAPEGIEPLMIMTLAHARAAYGADDPRTLKAELLLATAEGYRDTDAALQRLDRLVPRLRAAMPASAADTIEALRLQSFARARLNRAEPSYAALHEAIALAETHLGPEDPRTVQLIGLLSNTYGRFGKTALQLESAQLALDRARHAFGAHRPNLTLTTIERWYAGALRADGRPADALPILRRVVADQLQLDGSVTLRVRNARYELANALVSSGALDEALPLMREAIALERRNSPGETDERRALLDGLGSTLLQAQLVDEAWRVQLDAEAVAARVGTDVPRNQLQRAARRARLHALRGEALEAEATALDVERRAPDVSATIVVQARAVRAANARLQARPRDALRILAEPLPAIRGDGSPAATALSRAGLASERAAALVEVGDWTAARRAVRECTDLFRAAQVQPSLPTTICDLAAARIDLHDDRVAQARDALAENDRRWERLNPDSPARGEVLAWRAAAEDAAGDESAAARLRARAVALLRRSPLPAHAALAGSAVQAR